MNAPGDTDRLYRMLLQIGAALIMFAPVLMFAAREIPATILIIVSLLLITSAVRRRRIGAIMHDLGSGMRMPGMLLLTALGGLMLLSLTWSPSVARAASHLLHFAGAIVLAIIAIALAIRLRPRFETLPLGLALALAASLVAIDMWLSGALRDALFLSTDAFRLNRATVAIMLFLPLATAMLAAERRVTLLVWLWCLAIAAVFLSTSYSAKLALIVTMLVLPLSLALPRIMHRVTMIALPVTVLAMPWIASIANSLVPARIHAMLGYGSLTIRGEIWQETVPFVWQKPFFGWGVEASHVLPHLPEVAHLTQVQRDLLSWGHTHNAPLQIWLELGAVGATLTASVLYCGLRALRLLPAALLPHATTTVIAAFAVACVSHGAWQAWWWGLLGLIATAFAMTVASNFPEVLRRTGESGADTTA